MSMYATVSRPRRKSTVFAAALIGTAGFLAACKDDASAASGTSNAAVSNTMKEALGKASHGKSNLDISGVVTGQGQYTMNYAEHRMGPFVDIFQPALGGRGDTVRLGHNENGPYMFRVYTDAVHQNDENKIEATHINITLPENVTPGTYQIATLADVEDDQAYASMVGASNVWQFNRRVNGTVQVIDVGDTLTAAWEFVSHDRGGNAVNVSGAVKDLAFTPQPEVKYVLSANGDSTEHHSRLTVNRRNTGDWDLLLSSGVYLRLPSGIRAGTYAIRKSAQSDNDVTTTLSDYSFDEAIGELVLKGEGDVFGGDFTLKTTGKDVVELKGSFEQVALPK